MGNAKLPMRAAAAQIFGRLTRDVEVKFGPDGKPTAGMSVAVDRWNSSTGKREATFWNCRAYGATAERCGRLRKGALVYVTGEPYLETYTNKQGVETVSLKMWVNSIDSLEWDDDSQQEQQPRQQRPAPRPAPRQAQQEAPADNDDLPF